MCQDLMLINIHACIYSTSNDYVIVSPFLIKCKDMTLYTEWNYQFDLMSRWTKYTVPRWYLYVLQTLKTITIISKWEDFILKKSVFCTWRFAEACLADKSILMRASQNLCNMHRGNSGEHLGCIQDYSS